MPRYDFKCEDCGKVRPDVWMSTYRESQGVDTLDIAPCEDCGGILRKMPSAPNFAIHGYSAKNGYSK